MKVIYIKVDSKKRSLLDKKGRPLLIDPSKENPEQYLDFIIDQSEEMFGLIRARKNKKKGILTIKVIGLYDWFYTKEHRDFLRDTLV